MTTFAEWMKITEARDFSAKMISQNTIALTGPNYNIDLTFAFGLRGENYPEFDFQMGEYYEGEPNNITKLTDFIIGYFASKIKESINQNPVFVINFFSYGTVASQTKSLFSQAPNQSKVFKSVVARLGEVGKHVNYIQFGETEISGSSATANFHAVGAYTDNSMDWRSTEAVPEDYYA